MTLSSDTVRELLSAVPLFAGDDAAVLDDLLKNSQLVEPDKGELLFTQGEAAGFLYVVLSGWVKLCTHGDLFGEAVLYQKSQYPFSAEAASDSIVLRVPADVVRQRINNDGGFAARLLQAVSQRLNAMELQMEHLTVMTAPQRIGCFLLKLCRSKGDRNVGILLPYDKTLVAAFLGIKLETFSRSLAQLRELGVSVDGPQVTIENIEKLQKYVCSSCSFDFGECQSDKKNPSESE